MDIFVFGSNLAGRHGKGAALHARQHWGAVTGCGRGLTGRAYALPTKDEWLRSRTQNEVRDEIEAFARFTAEHPEFRFLLTPVGCGLAGFDPRFIGGEVARYAPSMGNVVLTRHWLDHLKPRNIEAMGLPMQEEGGR